MDDPSLMLRIQFLPVSFTHRAHTHAHVYTHKHTHIIVLKKEREK